MEVHNYNQNVPNNFLTIQYKIDSCLLCIKKWSKKLIFIYCQYLFMHIYNNHFFCSCIYFIVSRLISFVIHFTIIFFIRSYSPSLITVTYGISYINVNIKKTFFTTYNDNKLFYYYIWKEKNLLILHISLWSITIWQRIY